MEDTSYIVDGQTLVDNIHSIKQWVYLGLIRVHIPLSSVEEVAKLHQKSLEPKETPKDDHQQKRQFGRPRKEYPLFDINPWTAKEFLARAKSESGLKGVTFQQESGEEFTQWKAEDDKVVSEQPLAPPSSFSEALLRKLNIAKPEDKPEAGAVRPKLVAKSSNPNSSPFKYQRTPTINRSTFPEELRSYFSNVLWKVYDYENNPLEPEVYSILTSNLEIGKLAGDIGLYSVPMRSLRLIIERKLVQADTRDSGHGQVETDFPDAPRRPIFHAQTATRYQTQIATPQLKEPEETEVKTMAITAVEELLGKLRSNSPKSALSQLQTPLAELRPSVSYAMAAGAKSLAFGDSPAIISPMTENTPLTSKDADLTAKTTMSTKDIVQPANTKQDDDDEQSSDEEVVLFVGKKRRSQEVSRAISRPVSRPVTAVQPEKVSSPKPAKAIVESMLKPQSPVFTPGQLYTPTSPAQASVNKSQPVPTSTDNSPTRRTSSLKREGEVSFNVRGRGSTAPRTPRGVTGQNRHVTPEDAHRQSEMILQRQREAIKRSAQVQEVQATARAQQEAKVEPRLIELSPTSNPVVIDPDDFGRDYTIRPHAAEHGNSRGKGSGRRGGRGRGAKIQAQTPAQLVQQEGPKHEIEFVLKTGSPRGSARGRGRGRLWVP